MRIRDIKYPSFNSSEGIAVEFFFSGCTKDCEGCHNPELQDFNNFRWKCNPLEAISLITKGYRYSNTIVLTGGEPLEQEGIIEFLGLLRENFKSKSIWLYTGWDIEEVDKNIINNVDFIKTGGFDKFSSIKNSKWLASGNQVIWKIEGGISYRYYDEVNGYSENYCKSKSVVL